MSGVVRFLLVFGLLLGFSATVTSDTTVNDNDYVDDNSVTTSTKADSTESSVYEIGDRVIAGDIAYTVTGVRTASSVGTQYTNDQADGIFVIVDMKIENLGKETTQISSSYVKIIDSKGREFESDSNAWIYLDNNLLLKQIQPGLPTKGQTIFDVPVGTSCCLQVTDSVWGTKTKLISLGST